jgi:acetolactate synthase-1/2/3 large subunit
VERLAYLPELASVQLAEVEELVLLDAREPVSFFAYPGKSARLLAPGCRVHALAAPRQDLHDAMLRLAGHPLLPARSLPVPLQAASRPPRPRGGLNARKVCQALGHLLPEHAIVVDEAQTSGVMLPAFTAGAPAHDLLALTGGAIGQGLPLALGAAVACPGRPVIALVGDGAAMYTPQALWSMAREGLHVVAVVLNNRAYSILELELQRVGAAGGGARAREQFDLARPNLDFVRLAEGMGVRARRADTAQGFTEALEHALDHPGPHLIEAVVPRAYAGLKLRLLPRLLDTLDRLPQGVARAIQRGVAP